MANGKVVLSLFHHIVTKNDGVFGSCNPVEYDAVDHFVEECNRTSYPLLGTVAFVMTESVHGHWYKVTPAFEAMLANTFGILKGDV